MSLYYDPNATQPYALTVADDWMYQWSHETEPYYIGAVSYSHNGQANRIEYDEVLKTYTYFIDEPTAGLSAVGWSETQNIVVAYPRTSLEGNEKVDYINQAVVTLEKKDGEWEEKDVQAVYTYDKNPPVVTVEDEYSIDKYPYIDPMTFPPPARFPSIEGAWDVLMEERSFTTTEFYTYGQIRAYKSFIEKGPYSFEKIDDLLYINSYQMQPEDYSIDGINIDVNEYSYLVNSSYGTLKTDYESYQPVKLFYQKFREGEWIYAGEWRKTDVRKYIYVHADGRVEEYEDQIAVNSKYYIALPEGAIAVKMKVEQLDCFRVVLNARYKTTIHSTEGVRNALTETGNGSDRLHNFAALMVFDAGGTKINGSRFKNNSYGAAASVMEYDNRLYGDTLRRSGKVLFMTYCQKVPLLICRVLKLPVMA